MNFDSTSPTRLSTVSTLWDEHRIGRLQAIPKKRSINPGMQVMNSPGGKVLTSPVGKGFKNMRTGMGSPAFRGTTTMALSSLNVLITRSCPDGGDTAGALQEEGSVMGCCSTRYPCRAAV